MRAIYRHNIFFTLCMLTLVLLLAGGFGKILYRLNADVAYTVETQNAVALYEHNQKSWDAAKQTFDADTVAIAALEKTLVTTDTVPDFLSTLEALASVQKIRFNISSVATTPIAKVPALSITFSVLGEKTAIQDFLHSIEQLPQQVRFNSFSFGVAPDDESETAVKKSAPDWKAVVTIQVISYTK